jgi:hypothetical protein
MAGKTLFDTLKVFGIALKSSLKNISRENNRIDWSKEEILLCRLEKKLGKPRKELEKMISKNLMELLTMVPFDESRDQGIKN